MHQVFEELLNGLDFTNDIVKDSFHLLIFHHHDDIAKHSQEVACEAAKLAERFGVDIVQALQSGFLHDIGNMISPQKMVNLCLELGIVVLPEEKIYPLLLHQKLSNLMAVELFGINDLEILNAIECHSTLWKNPGKLDMILFLADKMQWDNEHREPFYDAVMEGLNISLEKGVFEYLKFGYKQKDKMKVLHPWFADAFDFFNQQLIH